MVSDPVTARDVLLQLDLLRFAQFVARIQLLLENSQIIPNHDDLVEECLERDFFRLSEVFCSERSASRGFSFAVRRAGIWHADNATLRSTAATVA